MTRKYIGKESVYSPSGEKLEVDIFQSTDLLGIGQYLMKSNHALTLLGKGHSFPKGTKVSICETRFPNFKRTEKGATFSAAIIPKGEKAHRVLIDERLNLHEKIAVLSHKLAHIVEDKEFESNPYEIAVQRLANLFQGYSMLSHPRAIKVMKAEGLDLNVNHVPKHEIKNALHYLVNSREFFEREMENVAHFDGLKVVENMSKRKGVERIVGIVTLTVGVILALSTSPLINSHVISTSDVLTMSSLNGLLIFLLGIFLLFNSRHKK